MDLAPDHNVIPARSSDRLLAGILAMLVALILAGLAALLLVGQRPATEFPEDTPQGVVQRYLRALESGEGDLAYSYLSESVKDDTGKRSYQRFSTRPADRTRRILLEGTDIGEEQARVTVSVSTITSEGPTATSETTIRLEFRLKREAGGWRITAPVYPPYLGYAPRPSVTPASSRAEEGGPWAAL